MKNYWGGDSSRPAVVPLVPIFTTRELYPRVRDGLTCEANLRVMEKNIQRTKVKLTARKIGRLATAGWSLSVQRRATR